MRLFGKHPKDLSERTETKLASMVASNAQPSDRRQPYGLLGRVKRLSNKRVPDNQLLSMTTAVRSARRSTPWLNATLTCSSPGQVLLCFTWNPNCQGRHPVYEKICQLCSEVSRRPLSTRRTRHHIYHHLFPIINVGWTLPFASTLDLERFPFRIGKRSHSSSNLQRQPIKRKSLISNKSI